jgi:cytochrome c oxidase subunit 3
MAVVTVVFSILATAYHMRMGLGDWKPVPEPRLLWFNTGLLVLSSAALQWARMAARKDRDRGMRFALYAGHVLAWGFVAGQLWAWQALSAAGYLVAANAANTFFYLITALHGLHLLGGLVALGGTTRKLWRGLDVALNLELCALYWHFLLVVWVALFALMLHT